VAGLIAACTAISASVAIATAASANTAARASTSARSSSVAASPARRGPSLLQLAMLEQRAKFAAHAQLGQKGDITGTVTGFDGQPVAGACVTAVGAGHSATTAAAPDGTFLLAGLAAGSYVLEYRDCAAAGRDLTSSSGYLTSWSAELPRRVQPRASKSAPASYGTFRP
jgi:Carboxypeptidase regulatory-like domain